jgi:hypothetical protein
MLNLDTRNLLPRDRPNWSSCPGHVLVGYFSSPCLDFHNFLHGGVDHFHHPFFRDLPSVISSTHTD